MKRTHPSLWIVLLAAALTGCANPDIAPGTTGVQTDAVRRALAEDTLAAGIRDHQSEVEPPAQAVAAYVQSLDQLELEHAPADFAAAMRAHRDAWAALIGPLKAFPEKRAEMHTLFNTLKTMPPPTGPEFQRLIEQVTATWEPVMLAAERAGVDPM